jgi:hypothetical protein
MTYWFHVIHNSFLDILHSFHIPPVVSHGNDTVPVSRPRDKGDLHNHADPTWTPFSTYFMFAVKRNYQYILRVCVCMCVYVCVCMYVCVCVCVALVIQHAMRMSHVVICGLPRYTMFFHIMLKMHHFRKKVTQHKCVFWFLLQHSYETFLILKRTERDIIKYVHSLHVKYPLFLSDFKERWIFSTGFRKKKLEYQI